MKPRSESELALMRQSGVITASALKKVIENIKSGVSGLELDKIAEEEIKRLGGEPSFKTVEGYQHTICITFNEQVVHGLPTERKIEEGDVISIDLGTIYQGWHSDVAWSVLVDGSVGQSIGSPRSRLASGAKRVAGEAGGSMSQSDKERFLRVGEEALWLGVKQAVEGNRIGDISSAIQGKVEGGGYSVVRSLVGHGVGRQLHEEPEVPGYGKAGTGVELKAGMTLAIEVIYAFGKSEVVLEDDGWTISSADKTLTGLFEMSMIVGKEKVEILTDWHKIP